MLAELSPLLCVGCLRVSNIKELIFFLFGTTLQFSNVAKVHQIIHSVSGLFCSVFIIVTVWWEEINTLKI